MVRIAEVLPGSIAADLELEAGGRLVRINGRPVRDSLDLRFLEADEQVELEVAPSCGGATVLYEIQKDAHESLGVVPASDAVRQCANKCVFCFVDGNPADARPILSLKDDDFRLSFTYGNYVTLTNLGPRGFERLIEQRLSPLYVSVHATEPAVRERVLGVPRGGDILDKLRLLLDAGIEVHTQVVLCPEWNDGPHLERTIQDLWSLGAGVLSLSVVPVGLTRYNLNRPVRLLTPGEAAVAIDQVAAARGAALRERGSGWVYVGDEMFFIAGRALPDASYYDDWPLTENGVGAVRAQLDRVRAALDSLPNLAGRRIALVTGTRMAELWGSVVGDVEAATGARLRIVPVRNRMYGETVNTAGLLPGADVRAAVEPGADDVVLVPAEALNDDRLFIDGLPFDELAGALAPAHVVAAHDLVAALDLL